MRIASLFFIVYTFILVTQPCQDIASLLSACDGEGTRIAHVEGEPDTRSDADLCSPFCICSCCSLPVSEARLAMTVTVRTTLAPVAAQATDYENAATYSFQNSIWQPPKA
ncbi:MAG: hypothetical protein KBD94_05285 [Pyrinomonadaceae bacterium]|nr:hypothetical protein [Pyrinomonadaceae bacterium]